MTGAIFCLGLSGVTTVLFLREVPNGLKEMSACLTIVLVAVFEWFVIQTGHCTLLGVQSCALACTALYMYNASSAPQRPVRPVQPPPVPKPASQDSGDEVSSQDNIRGAWSMESEQQP